MRKRIWGKHLKRDKMLETLQNERARRRSLDYIFIIMKIMMKVKLIMKAPTIMMKMRMDFFRLPQESLPRVRFKKSLGKDKPWNIWDENLII